MSSFTSLARIAGLPIELLKQRFLLVTLALLSQGAATTNADPGFVSPLTFPSGPFATAVAVADLNGDGILDLAVVSPRTFNSEFGLVSILLGNGDGTFRAGAILAAGSEPNSVAVSDLNGDGKLDLVTTSFYYYGRPAFHIGDNEVRVFLGNGDGTFQLAQVYTAGVEPRAVAIADFDGDGLADLLVLNYADYKVSVLLGNGDGTFQVARNYGTGTNPSSFAVADFNRDNHPDVAVADNASPGIVTILLNAADWRR